MGLPQDDLKQFLDESNKGFQKQTSFTMEKIEDIEMKSLMKNYILDKMTSKLKKITDQVIGNLMIHKGIDWSDWDQFPKEIKNIKKVNYSSVFEMQLESLQEWPTESIFDDLDLKSMANVKVSKISW